MEFKILKGIFWGLALALILIVTHPFYPPTGLLPELAGFFTAVPIWMGTLVIATLTPLQEGMIILGYFALIGAVAGAAFGRKKIWGWLFMIALSIHHYLVDERVGRPMGEILRAFLDLFQK